MSFLTKESLELLKAALAKTVETNNGCMSLRDTITATAHLYTKMLKTAVEQSEESNGYIPTEEDYKAAVTSLQDVLSVFGITVDLETLEEEKETEEK